MLEAWWRQGVEGEKRLQALESLVKAVNARKEFIE